MKRTMRSGFATLIMALAAAAIMTGAARAEQSSFTAMINVVFENNTVMFYKGTGAGLAKGQIYTLVQDGRPVASIEIEKADISFSIARVVSVQSPVPEGGMYVFQPYDPAAAPSQATETKERDRKASEAASAEEKTAEKRETLEVKETAQSSRRRETRTQSEEAAAPAPAAPPSTEKKRSEPAKPVEKKDTKEKKEKAPKDTALAFRTGASAMAGYGVGFTGMHIMPTTEIVPEDKARLSFIHSKLSSSSSAAFDIDSIMNSYHFGYGVSENAELTISGSEESANTLYDIKTSSIAGKYRIPLNTSIKNKDKSDEETDLHLAIMGSQGKIRTGFVSSYKFSVYGAALDFQASEQTAIHGFYGRAKVSGAGSSSKDKITGLGISHSYSDQAILFGEHMRNDDGGRLNSIGVRYLYNDEISLDAAYQTYSENLIFAPAAKRKAKGYQLGANLQF